MNWLFSSDLFRMEGYSCRFTLRSFYPLKVAERYFGIWWDYFLGIDSMGTYSV